MHTRRRLGAGKQTESLTWPATGCGCGLHIRAAGPILTPLTPRASCTAPTYTFALNTNEQRKNGVLHVTWPLNGTQCRWQLSSTSTYKGLCSTSTYKECHNPTVGRRTSRNLVRQGRAAMPRLQKPPKRPFTVEVQPELPCAHNTFAQRAVTDCRHSDQTRALAAAGAANTDNTHSTRNLNRHTCCMASMGTGTA